GMMYQEGKGVPRDYAEAVRWLRKAADQGDAKAQDALGLMYQDGSKRVPQDYAEAARWWRRAAEQGNVLAQFRLGAMYAEGRGVPRDSVLAYMWLNLAASNGHDFA